MRADHFMKVGRKTSDPPPTWVHGARPAGSCGQKQEQLCPGRLTEFMQKAALVAGKSRTSQGYGKRGIIES